ncbi:hypothetical protein J437_LFUL000799 [Ladona fulva]|uniref:Transmembrane protein 209 n=1 Tax=Ladona fulva TaxID=123851 RepID=A0A8K0KRS4_LADFU|nr:hypothetical protein J437_LFUL000799 [Ladona fulva]
MSRSPRYISRSPVVEDTFNMISVVNKANQSFFWAAANLSFLAILLYDIIYQCPSYTSAVYYGEVVLAIVLSLNTVVHVTRYIHAKWWLRPVVLTKKQRLLMGIEDLGSHFKNPEKLESKVSSPAETGQQRSPSPVRLTPKKLFFSQSSSTNISTMTTLGSPSSLNSSMFGNSSASILSSPNYSQSSPSWLYHRASPGMPNLSPALGTPIYSSNVPIPTLTPYPLTSANIGSSASSPGHIYTPVTTSPNEVGRITPKSPLESSFIGDLQPQSGVLSTPVSTMKSPQWSPVTPVSTPTSFSPTGTQSQLSSIYRCTYQLSPLMSVLQSSGRADSKKRDETLSPLSPQSATGTGSALAHVSDIWQRCGASVNNLERWTMNLRLWISQTVVERVVHEIDQVNEALGWDSSSGGGKETILEEQGIGHVSLERLRTASQLPHILSAAPNLPLIIPFLEATPNQKFLVGRLRKLAEGGCMSSFNWNGDLDRSTNAQQASEVSQCPTDAFIVAHLFATYLDMQMPSLPSAAVLFSQDKTPASVLSPAQAPTALSPAAQTAFFPLPLESPETRPFSIRHFARTPEELVRKKRGAEEGGGHMIIYQARQTPPHFQLVTTEEIFDVGKGRNNLFHTILLFLNQIKTKEHGMLGRVSLGKSGINLLWVIDGE